MSPYITTKHASRYNTRHNATEVSARVFFSLNVTGIILAIIAVLGYLVMLNILVSQSYTLKALGERLSAVREIQEKLDRDVASLQSSQTLSLQVASLGLVSVEEVTHLNSSQRAVVAKSAPLPVE